MAGELNTVVINTPDPTAPEGHDAKMIALVDSKNVDPERPDWLPAKFKNAAEMAASYKELEAKLGAPAAPAAAPAAPAAPAAAAPAAPAEAQAAVAKAGLDMAALNAEWQTGGTLSEASMAKLAAAGFDKATVDSYIAGQQALASNFESAVKAETPGGAEKYGEMVAWAKANLSQPEIDAYNTAVSSGNQAQARLAVAGLGVKFAASVGNEPDLTGGRPNGTAGDVFESIAQMKAAMGNPLYKEDPAYRAKVVAKLGRSNIM